MSQLKAEPSMNLDSNTEKMGISDLTVLAYEMGTFSMLNCVDTFATTRISASGTIHRMYSLRVR